MLPDNDLSSEPVIDRFTVPLRRSPYVDYEWGGVAVRDSTKGLLHAIWQSSYDGTYLTLGYDDIEHKINIGADVQNLSFAFDQNMNPCVVYNKDDSTYLYWYDTLQGAQVTTKMSTKFEYPQMSLDEHRTEFISTSDIILSYTRDNKLYYRLQRERYLQEHFLADLPDQRLTQIGMSNNYRFRWRYKKKLKGE